MPGRDTAPGFCCAIFLHHQVVSSFGETNPRCENATTGRAALRSPVTARLANLVARESLYKKWRPGSRQPRLVSSFGETNPRCENATMGTAALRSESRPASSPERGVLVAGVRPSAPRGG